MNYIYGPIKSRRLGLSLGLNLSRDKVCDFDCVYCQWGSVGKTFLERKEYASFADIIRELKSWLRDHPREAKELKFVTFSGYGEPTLNTALEDLIAEARKITGSKIAVITNSTLLGDPAVRKSILKADLIVPSLDAVDPESFAKIDRPHPGVKLEEIIEGLVALRREFSGLIWLEVMLVRGINDSPEHILKLKKVIERINPDKIQLNSPVRATAEKNILPAEKEKLEEIRKLFGGKAEII